MKVYIPTKGRATVAQQKSLAALPDKWRQRTTLVICPEEEATFRRILPGTELLVCEKKGVPAARQAALEHSDDPIVCMLDDDLRFVRRMDDWSFPDNTKMMQCTPEDRGFAMDWMEDAMRIYAAAGLGARGNNNGIPDHPNREASRMMRAFAVDRTVLEDLDIRFDKYLYWEDFHVTLCLLKAGYPNLISLHFCCDGVTNTAGGVSLYRNYETLRETRDAFLEEHAPFAEANDSKSAASWLGWDGDTVPDLRINWRKAFAYGLSQLSD